VLEPVEVVDFIGFEPGSCDIVLVRDSTLSPSRTFVLVCDFEKVPPSCAIAFDWPFKPPLPVSLAFERSMVLPPAALPPVANDEPVFPFAPVEVPPVPSVVAEVPPAAAEPPLPAVALPWACASAGASSKQSAAAAVMVFVVIMGLLTSCPWAG
jgi:hypothetical protein